MSRLRLLACLAVLQAAYAGGLGAQVRFRFIGADMYGGIVLTPNTEVGFAFGTRIGLLELGGTRLRAGAIIDWWTAENTELDVEVRDIVSGIDLWKDFGTSGWFRPYLGIGFGIHSVDVSPASGQDSLQPVPAEAAQLEGFRPGASAFGGATFRLSTTGAIWAIAEYRYNLVRDISNQEIRVGLRLLIRGSRGEGGGEGGSKAGRG